MPRLFRPLLFLVVPLFFAGCDDAGTDTFFLDAREVEFTFIADPGDFADGDPVELQSKGSVDLRSFIRNAGFDPETDIVSVRLVDDSGEIRVTQPPLGDLGFLESAQLRLFQGTSAPINVASGAGFPDTSDRAPLGVESTNIAEVVRNGAFGALLIADPAVATNDGFTLEATFDVVVEVEG
ncbi:MAG: hypothetical protein R3362_05315 [Rhodothermales bacterium]|nr:hypothetical protein [Rhodothermales bacterium]